MPGRFIEEDEEDTLHNNVGGEKVAYYDEEEQDNEVEVDTDMLPTLLVYQDGQLVHNWVRVDWEAGQTGVEDLLSRCAGHSLPSLTLSCFCIQASCHTWTVLGYGNVYRFARCRG